jgi:hypothetical protein
LVAYSNVDDMRVSDALIRAVLRQFSPLQNGKRAWIVRNFYPLALRRRYLLSKIDDMDFYRFVESLPLLFRDFFLGSKLLKRPQDLLSVLSAEAAGAALQVPDGLISHWICCLAGK